MNEKDLLKQIEETAKDITPPASLSPEQIEQKLQKELTSRKDTQTDSPSVHQPEVTDSDKASDKRHKKISIYRLGGIAAVFALALVGVWQINSLRITKNSTPTQLLADEQKAPESKTVAIAATEVATDTTADTTELTASAETTGTAELAAADEAAGTTELATTDEAADTAEMVTTSEAVTASEAATDAASASEPVTITTLTQAQDYQSLYDTLFQHFGGNQIARLYDSYGTSYAVDESAQDMVTATNEDAAAGETTSSVDISAYAKGVDSGSSWSQTNVQEFGVDEGDFVKTDGTWLYILKRSGTITIIAADQGTLEQLSVTVLPPDESVQELYLDGDRLSVITSGYYTELDDSQANVYSSRSTNRTNLYTYDISDRSHPVLVGTVTQDGSYSTSRKNGDYIYLFTHFSPMLLDTYEESDFIPGTSSGDLDASEIYLPECMNYSTYLVAASVNITTPDQVTDQKAVVSVASTFYASTENIYITNENWDAAVPRTELIKLHYENGTITGTAAGNVEGYLNNAFSMNEYNGYLRLVSTSYDSDYNEINALYILDENLKLTGCIKDLAPDETIRSARFMGNTGYFVTFRQTDPLFSVDLSDPTDPKILGDLKVSGFSSYLHFYGENLLLGMGYEADETTGSTTGLKLSMFDISDPSNVTELHRLVLDGITWCNSLEDYKSILIDPEKNLFGFTCDNRYLLFSYDSEKGFIKEFIYDFYNDMISDNQTSTETQETVGDGTQTILDEENGIMLISNDETEAAAAVSNFFAYSEDSTTRGLYINDTLYLVRPNAVTAFDMANDYKEIGKLMLE